MIDLDATLAGVDRLPLEIGTVSLRETPWQPATWVSPFDGKDAAVSKDLETALGVALPEANRISGTGDIRAVSVGPGQTLVIGAEVMVTGAACVDQSDAFAHLEIAGRDAREVLARHVPMDIREHRFPVGHAARTLLYHMTMTLMRTGKERYEILVFRSMLRTAIHDLERAMTRVAARNSL